MNNQVEQFLLKAKEDASFIQKISAMKTREEVVEAAKAEGIQLTVEDIDAVNEALRQESLKNISKDTPIGQFISKLIEDKSFAELVMSQTDVEEIIRIAGEAGIAITSEDLSEINKAMKGKSPSQNNSVELSEEDLEQVAGGNLFFSPAISLQLPITIPITITAPPPYITTFNPPIMSPQFPQPITITLNDPQIIK